MSNSSLVSYTKYSPFHSGRRTHSIDRISPHCIVGQCSIESLGSWMSQPTAKCSCNYGIGVDGRIGLIVDEGNRSWCTSSSANDQRAVTIECASDTTHPYAFKDVVYKQLIKLCVDICKRNGKNKLLWFADKNTSLNYAPKANEMVITVHRWFANKACPGDWLYNRLADLADKVNAQLGAPSSGTSTASTPTTSSKPLLKKGSEGSAVVSLQKALNRLGASLDVDGDFGLKTQAAVISFQKQNGLDPDGIVGPLTWAALEKKNEVSNVSFMVRVEIKKLPIRKEPGEQGLIIGTCPVGAYTIVQTEKVGTATWGRLKSGAGWIDLQNTKRI